MDIYAVAGHTGLSHETPATRIYSFWTTHDGARQEIKRLMIEAPLTQDTVNVETFLLNDPSDIPILFTEPFGPRGPHRFERNS